MKATELLASLVPTGKQLAWLVAAGGAMFMAGVGFTLQGNDYATLPAEMDSLTIDVRANTVSVSELRSAIEDTDEDLTRLTCLASLSATGQTVDPLELPTICP